MPLPDFATLQPVADDATAAPSAPDFATLKAVSTEPDFATLKPSMVVPFNPSQVSNDPDQIFQQPAQLKNSKDVAAAANAIEGRYDYISQRTDDPDQLTQAGQKRQTDLDALKKKAGAVGLPFDVLRSDEDIIAEKVAKAKLTPEDIHALVPTGILTPKGERAVSAVESGVADAAGGATSPENLAYAGMGAPAIPGFTAMMLTQGATQTAGGVKKIIQGQPGGGEQATEGMLSLGMAALPAVLPNREAPAAEAPAARPVDDWLPGGTAEGTKAPPATAAGPDFATLKPAEAPAGTAAAAPAPATGTPAEEVAPATPAPGAEATPAPAAIPVGDEKEDAGTTDAGDVAPRIVRQALDEMTDNREPVPTSVVQQSGLKPETLPVGYALNDAGTHYEFTEPEVKPTAEQQMARDNVQAMADLRVQKGETPPSTAEAPIESGAPRAKGDVNVTSANDENSKLVSVTVSPEEYKAAREGLKPGTSVAIATALAKDTKRAELFGSAISSERPGSEMMPANQLFVGDTLKVNGHAMTVKDLALDADTGQPSHVVVDGAYGRQQIPADASIHLDAGSLKSPAMGVQLLSRLESLKMDTRGQLHAFGLLPEAWNTLIDLAKLGVKGGMAVADAVKAGIAQFKQKFPDQTFDEAGAERHLTQNLLNPPRQFAEQLNDAQDISDALKGSVTNTTYTRRPQEEDADYAQRILKDVGGPDQARAVFNDPGRLPSPVRMALGMQILKAYDAAGRHADAASFFDNDFAQHTTDVAQGLSMLNAWHSMSKDGKIFWARKKVSDAARNAVAPVQRDIDAAKTELEKQNATGIEKTTADPQVQGAAKEAITDAVTNSKETHNNVVMELAQPWSLSPEILNMARAAVRAKADELLNRAPRPAGFTPAQHLRTILDDLAKRAADIAAGHYQGAEPGVTLRDKLQQRLGISKEAAGRLANSLDKEFARQVEAAKKKLPTRVAKQIAKQQRGPLKPNEDAKLSRSIPDREAEAAAKSLVSTARGAGDRPPALQEFYQRLTGTLRQMLPDRAGKTALTDIQRIAEAFSNPEKFEDVWQRLGTELRAKYGIEGMTDVQNTLGKVTPESLMETQLDRSIRKQLTDSKVKLGQLVREHYTKVDATKAELTDKLVKQAGLDGDAAKKLASAVKSRFEALTKDSKRAALEQLLKPVKRLGLAKPQMVDRLVQLSNVGAFDDTSFWNAIKERMNLPEWTPALRDQLNGLADKIGKIPVDRVEEAQRAQTEFLNALERAKGISNLELGMAFYMQNILSGLTTHVRVAVHTSGQMAAATIVEMGRALASGRLEDIPLMAEALARGGGRAFTQMKDIFRSGTVVGSKVKAAAPLSVLEQIRFGEKGGTTFKQGAIARSLLENRAAKILNLWKYNSRLITAQHMLYYAPAEEMKVALLASRQARTEGLSGMAAVQRARQMLGYGAAAVRSAEAQAIREGLEGTRAKMRVAEILKANVPAAMKDTARDYALRQTFLSDPYGFIGAIANSVANMKASDNRVLATAAKVIVPFTRIAANIFNEGLNYTLVGSARAAFGRSELLGHKFSDITPEVKSDLQRELYAKSALGTMLLTGIAVKASQGLNQPNPGFTVYGQGPSNPQDQAAWRASGAIPFSIKVGNRYVSYANTPANVMLAALGNYLDGVRDSALYKRPSAQRLAQDLPMRLAASTVGMGRVVLEQPFLSALVDLFKTSSEPNPEVAGRGAAKMVSRMTSSFVVPNLLRQVDRFYDPTAYSQNQLSGILTSQVPFVRQTGRPMLNALGQPLQSPVFGLFTGTRSTDPLIQMLTDHNAWPAMPDRNRTTVNGVPVTDSEFYTYCKARGDALATMLGKPGVPAILDRISAQRTDLLQKAQQTQNPVAKAKLTQIADGLQNKVMDKYDAAANKQAEAAVIKMRGY